MRVRLFVVAGMVLASILACSNPSTSTTPATDQKTPAPPAPPAPDTTATRPMTVPPAPPPTQPTPPTGTSTVAIGVIECDEYIIKMTECLGKMDATSRATLEASFNQTRDAWRLAAGTPQGKASLSATCRTALDSLTAMTCAPKEEPKAEEKDDEHRSRSTNERNRTPAGQGQGRNR